MNCDFLPVVGFIHPSTLMLNISRGLFVGLNVMVTLITASSFEGTTTSYVPLPLSVLVGFITCVIIESMII